LQTDRTPQLKHRLSDGIDSTLNSSCEDQFPVASFGDGTCKVRERVGAVRQVTRANSLIDYYHRCARRRLASKSRLIFVIALAVVLYYCTAAFFQLSFSPGAPVY
jgi:hypothetical protein